jgi:hypothetical protein
MSLFQAKLAAVLSVVYAGMNVYQFTSEYEAVREKARMFSEIAAGQSSSWRLRLVRALFYLAAPLIYLMTMIGAGLPGALLIAAGIKFWASSFVGIRTEHRLLRGEDYTLGDHRLSRIDAAFNIALAGAVVWQVLETWL